MSCGRDLEKANKRVAEAFHATCNGIVIDIMDMAKIYSVGRHAIAEGIDDVELRTCVRAFVETIRKN